MSSHPSACSCALRAPEGKRGIGSCCAPARAAGRHEQMQNERSVFKRKGGGQLTEWHTAVDAWHTDCRSVGDGDRTCDDPQGERQMSLSPGWVWSTPPTNRGLNRDDVDRGARPPGHHPGSVEDNSGGTGSESSG